MGVCPSPNRSTALNSCSLACPPRCPMLPRYEESPAAPAKMVSANPETIWLARRLTASTAWIMDVAVGARAPWCTPRTRRGGAGVGQPPRKKGARDPGQGIHRRRGGPIDAGVAVASLLRAAGADHVPKVADLAAPPRAARGPGQRHHRHD